MSLVAALKRHPARTAVVAAVLLALGGFALWWFAPWNLFIDKRVDEALPGTTGAVAEAEEAAGDATAEATGTEATGTDPNAEPATLASGEFAGLEHATSGEALVVELEDGRRFLRLDDLETSNGPDLRVYLSSVPASDDWYVYDDEEVVDLGGLKGNIGSSNYAIPANVDLADFETAVIWCRRFSVGFGVAPLEPAT